ncbi:MAG: LuxR C-terminal-related transcriptional regulator [Thioalkalivibrionaceae bacterium]
MKDTETRGALVRDGATDSATIGASLAGSGAAAGCDILIVDDHPMFVEAIASVLAIVAPGHRVKTCDRLEMARRAIESSGPPTWVFLDLSLPDSTPAGVLGVLDVYFSGSRVVILSGHDDPATRRSAAKNGACAFLSKRLDSGQLLSVFRALLTGSDAGLGSAGSEGSVSDGTAPAETSDRPDSNCSSTGPSIPKAAGPGGTTLDMVTAGVDDSAELREFVAPLTNPQVIKVLSIRQKETLALMALGWSNKEIARHLEISPGTVKTHVQEICRRLGARNRTEATRIALRVRTLSGV